MNKNITIKNYDISICIPSYNRPEKLNRLLKSIDCNSLLSFEIVICEDHSPKRNEIREVVEEYKKNVDYDIHYIENTRNLGYDGNIRKLITVSSGVYIIYMGDDDMFVPGELDTYIKFLNSNTELGYVLRSYKNVNNNGQEEKFLYYPEVKFFDAGKRSYVELFRKSVFISGFTFKRELALSTLTTKFDGTLLYQLYILAEICLNYPSAAYNKSITQGVIEEKDFYFGASEAEKEFRVPGKITLKGEVKFINSFVCIAEFIDDKYNIRSKDDILVDMSKYSYPMISSIRNQGLREFLKYVAELRKIGLGCTVYFYVYVLGLIIFGESNCRRIIKSIKKILGKTPVL